VADALEAEVNYDDPDFAENAKAAAKAAEAKPPESPAEKATPKHKAFFLRQAASVGISEDEANEMDSAELDRAIALSRSTPSAATSQPSGGKEAAPKVEEDDLETLIAAIDNPDFEPALIAPIKRLAAKMKSIGELTERVSKFEELESKREQREVARKIDAIFADSGIDKFGNKPFDKYRPGAPEIEARITIFSAANASRKEGETIEQAIARTLKLFNLTPAAAEDDEEPAPAPKPTRTPKDILAERRQQFAEGGVVSPVHRKTETTTGKGAALDGIASILRKG
jgi:hypothetical protein